MSDDRFELEQQDDAPNYQGASFPPPRDFQTSAHEKLRAGARAGHRAQLLMAPTGAGKTYLGLRVAHEALAKARRATFVCDRITLINQTSDTADRFGLSAHGVVQASHWRYRPSMPFQIASAQTLHRREWPESNVIIVDEAHTQLSVITDEITRWKDKPLSEGPMFIGLSATPFSRGLGLLYTNLVNAATMHELVGLGVLTPLRVLSCTKANMKGAATSGGEWTDGAAAERGMEIVGDVVGEWVQYANGRKTIVFGATIAHCEEICRQFNEAGVMAAVFCATTTASEREAILKDYRRHDSRIRVLVSVEALAKGFDVPDVTCVVDCRPLRKSLSTFIQMVGRGLRASIDTGKTECLLLDHSGNVLRFAKDFEDVYFNGLAALDAGEKLDAAIRNEKDEEKSAAKCPKCGYTPFLSRCMACGHKKERAAAVDHEAGAGMREIMIGKVKLADDKRHLFNQIVSYCRGHGNPETVVGRSLHKYREIVGSFPPSYLRVEDAQNVPITQAVRNQIIKSNIAYVEAIRKGPQ
jgi:DNA repair protein RadD